MFLKNEAVFFAYILAILFALALLREFSSDYSGPSGWRIQKIHHGGKALVSLPSGSHAGSAGKHRKGAA